MRKIMVILLCVVLCVNMLIVAYAVRDTNAVDEHVYPTVTLDSFEYSIFSGYYYYFVAKHIKVDKNNGQIYSFKDWSVEGVEIEDTGNIYLYFIMPDNDIVLTPNYYLLGNVDEDETVTCSDITALIKGLKNDNSEKEFDVNLDGEVSANDITTLIQLLKGTYDVTELYYTVNVEGEDVVKYECPATDYGTLNVPVVAILEAYGAKVEWENDTIATITYNTDCYRLDIAEPSMYLVGDKYNYNYLSGGAPGSKFTHTVGIKELYIDDVNAKYLIYDVINDLKNINFDFENRVVNVIDNPNF